MATRPLPPDIKTARKYARAWVRLEAKVSSPTEGQLRGLERILKGLAHWYDDEVVDLECDCDACQWWAAEIHRARRARN